MRTTPRLCNQLKRLHTEELTGKYVCVIALARDGQTLATFTGEAPGELLTVPRGTQGFGYDPFFYFPALGKTFAELSLEQKREHSHRGKAIRACWIGICSRRSSLHDIGLINRPDRKWRII